MEKTERTALAEGLRALLDEGLPLVSNLSNAAAYLYAALDGVNWAGFYLAKEETLFLGPFCGLPACTRIPFSRGVCGAAAREKRTQLVPDVHAFAGHIACDAASRSEVVTPLVRGGAVLGVLDVDSPHAGRFSQEDAQALAECAALLAALPGWGQALV